MYISSCTYYQPMFSPRAVIFVLFFGTLAILTWQVHGDVTPADFPTAFTFLGNATATVSLNATSGFNATLVRSLPDQTGGLWVSAPLNLTDGWELRFRARFDFFPRNCLVTNTRPDTIVFQNEYCLPSTGDGMAVVIQSEVDPSLVATQFRLQPLTGATCGYGGMNLSRMVAVEFDTHENGELNDPYENHLAVQLAATARHNPSVTAGLASLQPELKDPDVLHDISVTYIPHFSLRAARARTFSGTAAAFQTLTHGGHGLGMLLVFVDQRRTPDIVVPVDLRNQLFPGMLNGTQYANYDAWLGLVAGTGERYHRVTVDSVQWCTRRTPTVNTTATTRLAEYGLYCDIV